MASSSSSSPNESHLPNFTRFIQSTSSNFLSIFSKPTSPPSPISISSSSSVSSPPIPSLSSTRTTPSPSTSSSHPNQSDPMSSNSEIKNLSSISASGFPSTVKISSLNTNSKGGGPAFVGQVFTMCDFSGTGLMAVTTPFESLFLSKRTPDWIRKLFTKKDNNGPVFRFFMDLGDAVSYVKRLNIPTGVVGACRLDVAYEHFREKPHMFQFVPNNKQVKAANKLLKTLPHRGGSKKVDGVPVFTAENLDIAIATGDGIKWYTPYFFDKNMLDNILEESVDQQFHALIQSRHMKRRRDVIDDDLTSEVVEEIGDSLWEPPEVHEMIGEMGDPGMLFSVISKAAEMQLLYSVDKALLGNRWLRKATGIQPKFPYMVDSFEKRSASSFLKAGETSSIISNSEAVCGNNRQESLTGASELRLEDSSHGGEGQLTRHTDFRFPFGNWFSNPWKQLKQDSNVRLEGTGDELIKQVPPSPLLPKITMVGISTGETGQMSKASLKKTMESLTRELEQTGHNDSDSGKTEARNEHRDPLFVANVGDFYSSAAKAGAPRWVQARNN